MTQRGLSNDLLQATISVWQPLSLAPLTEIDASEILADALALADLLKKIDEEATDHESLTHNF